MIRHDAQKTNTQAALRDLAHPSPRVRAEAAQALGAASGPQLIAAAQALQARIDDEDDGVRYEVALAIGRIKDRAAVPALIEVLESDHEPMVRQAAAVALGEIADPRATAALLAASTSPSADLRFQVICALAHVAGQAAVEPLRRALDDEDSEVRAAAAAGLGDLVAEEASEALAARLADPATNVAIEAAVALARLGDRRAMPLLVETLHDREYALLAAEHLFGCADDTAVPALRQVLRRWLAPRLLKVWVAGTLARLDDSQGRDKLLGLLHSREQSVRGLAIQVLGAIAQPWSRQALEELGRPPYADHWQDWQEEIAEALAGNSLTALGKRENS